MPRDRISGPWFRRHCRPAHAMAKCRGLPFPIQGLAHTWASHAVMNGMPLMVVARNLGHADTRMVEKHYGHLAPSYVAEAVRKSAPRFGLRPERKLIPLQ